MRLVHAALIALSVLPLLAQTGLAADLAVTSRVDTVTLYPDGATVIRAIDFDTAAGDTTLVATDFPTSLDPASIRLDAAGASGVLWPASTRARSSSIAASPIAASRPRA